MKQVEHTYKPREMDQILSAYLAAHGMHLDIQRRAQQVSAYLNDPDADTVVKDALCWHEEGRPARDAG